MKINKIAILGILSSLLFINEVTAQENQKIDDIINKKRSYNKHSPYSDGYKIQLYNGSENIAYEIKNKYEEKFDDNATVIYESPEWKVRVGNYKSRLDADRALIAINEKFNGAIILATKIKL